MLKEYGTDVQRLFLEMMLEDASSYVRVQNIYNPENFDKSLRPAAVFIKEHSDKHKTMPDRLQISATTGIKLQAVPDLNEGHFEWFMEEFESFTRRQELERAILKAADLLEKGDYDPVEKLIKDAVQISLTKDLGTDYFAGGEPLIMKEHYYLLEKLIEAGKTDVRIQYNTNFSELAFKDKHVFEYWKHFKNVSVGASLDASGARAELMRKGTDWAQAVDNRKRMQAEVPHVDFYISATISSMNVLHVLDFHREWTDLGLINAKDFNVNICQSPEWYRVDIFPAEFKQDVIVPAYEQHIAWLKPQDNLKRATNGFRSTLNLLKSTDQSHLWPRFVEECTKLDMVRKEDFWATFPELASLRDYEPT